MAMRKIFSVRRTKSDPAQSKEEPYRRLSVKDILLGNVPSEPAMPTLPERTWKPPPQLPPELPSPRQQPSELPSPRLPPDLPISRPPDIPSKRAPEPFPAGDPPRPPRSIPSGSPIGQMWYHANLDRKRAEALLKRYSKDGTFIIRDSARVAGEYSLSLWYGGAVRHLRIRIKPDEKFVLGEEKSDECAFETVMDLVAHHKHEVIKLKSGGETTLKYECPK